jgi:hypothetical protein
VGNTTETAATTPLLAALLFNRCGDSGALSTVYLTPKEHESSSKKLLNTEQSKENDRTSTEDELVSSKSSFPSKDDINKTISCPDLCSTSRESVCGSDGVTVGFF